MSGGHFNYDQYKIGYIAEEIQKEIDAKVAAEAEARRIADQKQAAAAAVQRVDVPVLSSYVKFPGRG